MDINDPRLEKARQEMKERVEKFNDLMLAVMKNHSACEQFLNDLLSAAGRRWKRTCAGKLDVCRNELTLPEIEPPIWKVLEAGNKLRNQIAHVYDAGKIAAKMATLRKTYLDALTPEQRKGLEELDDARIAASAFEMCGGYLVVAADRVREEREKTKAAKG